MNPTLTRVKSWMVKYPPDTVFLMMLCVVSSSSQLLAPHEILSRMPMSISIGWSVLLLMGATVSLTGIFWHTPPVGLLIEGAGRSMLWPACVAYAITLFVFDQAWYSGSLVLAFGVVCYIRSVYVRYIYAEWLDLLEKHT